MIKRAIYIDHWDEGVEHRPAIVADDYTILYKVANTLQIDRSKAPIRVNSAGVIEGIEGIFGIELILTDEGAEMDVGELSAMPFAQLTRYLKI